MKLRFWLAGLSLVAGVRADTKPANSQYHQETPRAVAPLPPPEPVEPIFAGTIFPELKLRNGEVLIGAKFLNGGVSGANFLIDRTIRSIPYKLLPAALSARAMQSGIERIQLDVDRRSANQPLVEQARVNREATQEVLRVRAADHVAANAQLEAEASERSARAKKIATSSALNYFNTQWRPGMNSVFITNLAINIISVEPRVGWDSEWDVIGEANIDYYMTGNISSSTRQKFSAVLVDKTDATTFDVTLH